eukprot:CAMPEP_0170389270 /NCGR_PEP_ID=MMETSP0117_2-20130122/18529_1 /TAXON_ID=400756 /ORGANISM="Durinskia baltica, Strain CSIRO CS-38" /LENGTH=139 /DNA_ID=CAMNT_0010645249 /DNA_START=36 /DNA_END=455 /DNA_ORIENTATION=+
MALLGTFAHTLGFHDRLHGLVHEVPQRHRFSSALLEVQGPDALHRFDKSVWSVEAPLAVDGKAGLDLGELGGIPLPDLRPVLHPWHMQPEVELLPRYDLVAISVDRVKRADQEGQHPREIVHLGGEAPAECVALAGCFS